MGYNRLVDNRIAILKCGSTYGDVAHVYGDFDDWFLQSLKGSGARFSVIDVTVPFKVDPTEWKGLILTGSLASAYQDEPWILRIADWLRKNLNSGVPVLGVCFGHQLIARALGGMVRRCPGGLEIGTHTVEPTAVGKRDFLFDDFPPTFLCQETHVDEVAELPPDALNLAGNGHSPIQAFGIGAAIRGVQFHPEMHAQLMKKVLVSLISKGKLRESGQKTLASVKESPHARRVLENFVRYALSR